MSEGTQIDLAPVHVGEILASKYKVERVLGAGGMGVVVLARHIHLDQQVALKFLLAESLANPKVVARFEREARAAVKLKGEHVARVLDVGKMETGAPYIVMEFLEGQDLSNVVDTRGQLSVAESTDYLLQTCEALAEAHANGIVHRDLKPGNLFLTRRVDGRSLVKVLDFGISKLEGIAEDLSLTQTSEVVGSPKYMSPEQLRGARFADARSDIWSLGVIYFELLTSDVPFTAETMAHLCAIVISEPPIPVKRFRQDVPPGVEAIIAKCLQKDPARRYQNVADLAVALEPFASVNESSAAQRVLAVASSGSFPSIPSSPNIAVRSGSQSTSIGWGPTEVSPGTRSRGRWLGAGAGLLVAAVGVAAFLKLHGHAQAASDAPVHATTDPSAVSSSAESTTASTPPSAAPDTSASLAASSALSASAAASSHAPPAHVHKPRKPAAPNNGVDDMPNERN